MKKLLRAVGIDRAVGYTLAGNGWTVASSVVTLAALTHLFSPVQQGYYYAFAGVLAATGLFELGLSGVIMQCASHESAHLAYSDGVMRGDSIAKKRLSALLRKGILLYSIVIALVIVFVTPLGYLFFARHAQAGHAISWQIPWVWTAIADAGTMAVVPLLGILEGCGQVKDVARLRMRQSIAASLVLWAVLVCHGSLYSVPAAATAGLLSVAYWLYRHRRALFADLLSEDLSGDVLDWRRDIWPFQWKMAVSSACGYLIFYLFVPLLFAARGAAVAGQMGLSLNVAQGLSMLSIAWLSTKSSPFGSLIARKDWEGLDRLFFPSFWQSWTVMVIGCAAAWSGAWILTSLGFPISHRILPPAPLGLLLTTAVINQIVFAEALYLRAHKLEPFLWLSVAVACLVGPADALLARPYGATGMMWAYLLINLIVGLGGGTWIFRQKRKEWHTSHLPVMPPILAGIPSEVES